MKVAMSIDKLALFTKARFEVTYPYKEIPNYKFASYVVKNGKTGKNFEKEKEKDRTIIKYLTVMKFKHVETGNVLIISNQRKSIFWAASPVYLIFYPGFFRPITYPDVLAVEQFFQRECGIKLRVSVVHPAVDLVWKSNKKTATKRFFGTSNPAARSLINHPIGNHTEAGTILGSPILQTNC